ncbi:MAG: GrpB family protein [Candidatus Thermoplasmatota archaeon]
MSEVKIKLVEYDPTWAEDFQRLKGTYMDSLGDLLIGVEHVGSTAVPGLCAKPNLDIDLVIEDYSSFQKIIYALAELGYEYQSDFGIEGRESFRRKDEKVPWDGSNSREHPHNLYVCPQDSRELKRHLAFRDHLRENEDCLKRYGDLKRRLARKYSDDREAYTEGKTKFIERVLEEIM